jgi:hypothetical protein
MNPWNLLLIHFLFSERTRFIHLNLSHLKALDRQIILNYDKWVADAPETYQQDNFLHSRHPITVTSIYGQNQPLSISEDDDPEDFDNWARYHDFSNIRYVTLSLATHLRYFKDVWINNL